MLSCVNPIFAPDAFVLSPKIEDRISFGLITTFANYISDLRLKTQNLRLNNDPTPHSHALERLRTD
jgi:hypothetical protein